MSSRSRMSIVCVSLGLFLVLGAYSETGAKGKQSPTISFCSSGERSIFYALGFDQLTAGVVNSYFGREV